MTLSKEKQETLKSITNDLKKVDNVVAIVLGGSYATGKATETSDIDIGIYYFEDKPFLISDIKSIANKYAVTEPTVTDFYGWGPWVNGGAWIQTQSGKFDFIYRNIDQLSSTIEKAKNGEWENHFEQQPPYGFSSVIYLAETSICIPLHDPDNVITKLKTEVEVYPPKLKQAIIQYSLWPAEFAIWHADYFCAKKEVFNVMGCLTRAVKNIIDALFAINELYPIGDKRALETLEKAVKVPLNLKEKVEKILCVNMQTMNKNIDILKSLHRETIDLTNGTYKPFFALKSQ